MKPAITLITQKMIFSCFKKLITPVLAMIITMASHAQIYPIGQLTAAYKEISSSRSFDNVEITGEVTVVLTNALSSNIMLRGSEKDLNMVRTIEKERSLEINAEKKRTVSKLIVYLPVTNVHSLKITGNAQVFSSGDIKVDDLEIILNGNSLVKVYCYGNLRVKPAEGYDLGD